MKPDTLHGFKEQELANIIYGLGLMGKANQAILNTLADEVTAPRHLRHFSERELCNIIWAFGKLEYLNASRLRVLLEEVLKPERVENIKEQGLSNIMYGLACVSPRLLTELSRAELAGVVRSLVDEAQVPQRMRSFNAQNLANMGWSLAQLGYHDNDFLQKIINRYVRLAEKNAHPLKANIMLLHACGSLRFEHPYFVDVIVEWLNSDLTKLHPARVVTKLLQDMTLAGCLTPTLFLKLCLHLQRLMARGDTPTVDDWGEMFVAVMHMRTYHPETISDGVWDTIFSKAKRGWTARKHSNRLIRKQVAEVLTQLGVRHECGGLAVDGQMPVDIVIDPGAGQAVIEVDGPSSYACNETEGGHKRMGITEWRNTVLRKGGWRVRAEGSEAHKIVSCLVNVAAWTLSVAAEQLSGSCCYYFRLVFVVSAAW